MLRFLTSRFIRGYRANRSTTPLLLSERELARQLRVERQRSDRRQIPFCRIDISLIAGSHKPTNVQLLAKTLRRRLRYSDIVGHLGPVSLGVVLTDTPEAGGRIVFDDLQALIGNIGLRVDMDMFVYNPDSKGTGGTPQYPSEPGSDERVAEPTHSELRMMVKRAIDIAGSALGLLLFGVPLAVACVLIRATSDGPALFTQVREGKGGKPFRIIKLRTMFLDAEHQQAQLRHLSERDGPAFKLRNDPRVTPIGGFLRRTCVDELPQLLNVLLGDMSLVGPRPLPWKESRAVKPWQRRRLDVKPGMTGPWQVSKHDEISFDDWMRLDLAYVDTGTTWDDIKLLFKTAMVPLKARGNH